MSELADVILLHGPPLSGRTHFYNTNLADSHLRINLEGLYQEDPSLTIRQLVNRYITGPLKQGQKVAIDDSFQTFSKRDSYIGLIKKKVPCARCACYNIHPEYGSDQLYWAGEYAAAHRALTCNHGNQEHVTCNHDNQDLNVNIEAWYQKHEPPGDDEGFVVRTISSRLYAHSHYKFECPCLFVQWEGIVKVREGEHALSQGAAEVLRLWYETYKCGRVVIVSDGNSSNGVTCPERDQQLLYLFKELAKKLPDVVVYVMAVTPQLTGTSFRDPPHPGVIASLQQLLCLDLQHAGSMYLYQSPSHMTMADSAGIKHIKASRVCGHPTLVKSSHACTKPKIPAMLQSLEVMTPCDLAGVRGRGDGEQAGDLPVPTVPLSQEFVKAEHGYAKVCVCSGRTLYVFAKDADSMNRHQSAYAKHASLTSDPKPSLLSTNQPSQPATKPSASTGPRSTHTPAGDPRALPAWMVGGSTGGDVTRGPAAARRNKRGSSSSSAGGSAQERREKSQIVYVLSTDELVETAKLILKEAGKPVPTDEEIKTSLNKDSESEEDQPAEVKVHVKVKGHDMIKGHDIVRGQTKVKVNSPVKESPRKTRNKRPMDIFDEIVAKIDDSFEESSNNEHLTTNNDIAKFSRQLDSTKDTFMDMLMDNGHQKDGDASPLKRKLEAASTSNFLDDLLGQSVCETEQVTPSKKLDIETKRTKISLEKKGTVSTFGGSVLPGRSKSKGVHFDPTQESQNSSRSKSSPSVVDETASVSAVLDSKCHLSKRSRLSADRAVDLVTSSHCSKEGVSTIPETVLLSTKQKSLELDEQVCPKKQSTIANAERKVTTSNSPGSEIKDKNRVPPKVSPQKNPPRKDFTKPHYSILDGLI